ncbi:hypothetical protein BS78_K068900 [Paspalum vaginatum]|uniref:Uncharacterized protein n=1 Tax=Paspalum vaginatum TaxID=158149 RepID=A0A9W7XCT8_9POAL|nr:hypothetical protein BS78_K068900 [Paspalum vaginatum]
MLEERNRGPHQDSRVSTKRNKRPLQLHHRSLAPLGPICSHDHPLYLDALGSCPPRSKLIVSGMIGRYIQSVVFSFECSKL